jgi:hypothetical protein
MFAMTLLSGDGIEAVANIVDKIVAGVIYLWIALGILAILFVLAFAVLSWNKGKED